MPERWERELGKLGTVDVPPRMRARVDEGPHGDGMPPQPGPRQRVVAAVVAFAVFAAAGALTLSAFRWNDDLGIGGIEPEKRPFVVTIERGDTADGWDVKASFQLGSSLSEARPLQVDGDDSLDDAAGTATFDAGVPTGTPIEFRTDASDIRTRILPLMLTGALGHGSDDVGPVIAAASGSTLPATPGLYSFAVEATWEGTRVGYEIQLPIVAAAPGELDVTLLPPLRGSSLPSAWVTYGDVVLSVEARDWRGPSVTTNDVLPSLDPVAFPEPLALGTLVRFTLATGRPVSDLSLRQTADKESVRFLPSDPGDPLGGSLATPDQTGEYVLETSLSTDDKDVWYALAFTIEEGADPASPPVSEASGTTSSEIPVSPAPNTLVDPPSAAVDELHLVCANGTTSVEGATLVVNAQAYGVRVIIDNPEGDATDFALDVDRWEAWADGGGAQLTQGSAHFDLALPPGIWSIACVSGKGARMGAVEFEVVDPNGLWVPGELSCPPSETVDIDETVSPPASFDDIVSKVVQLQPSDKVLPPGYPQEIRASMLPAQQAVVRDGRVVGMFDIWPAQIHSDGTPHDGRVQGTTCASAALIPHPG